MPKRKFVEFRDLSRPPKAKGSTPPQNDRIDTILTHSKTALFRALKIARGFERQKLGRRQKTAAAEKQLDNVRRLKLEVIELKALDLAKTAESHLYKSLLKVKSIAACDGFPDHIRGAMQQGKQDESAECLNVQARLFKTDVVQEATDVAVEGIRAALGVAKTEAVGKRRLRAKDYGNAQLGVATEAEHANADVDVDVPMEDEEEWEGISSSVSQRSPSPPQPELNNDDDHEDHSSIDDDTYSRYTARLASSSPSPSSQSDSPPHQNQIAHPPHARYKYHSISPSPPLDPHNQPKLLPQTTSSTTFLPTLQTGYYSGSDSSAPSDDDPDRRGAQRKNRMGQQARRALWEKKYKDRARHLQNGSERKIGRKEVGGRDEGWDARKGALEGNEAQVRSKSRKERRNGGRGSGGIGRKKDSTTTGANLEIVSNRRRDTDVNKVKTTTKGEGPLHPSWEAARRAKEAKTAAKPMGKKVVF